MRRTPRLIATAVLIAFTGVLGGCSSFDPSDMLDFLDTKKKLPGDRKPVFPEGVPGLEQGVPKDMYKGAQQQPDPNGPAVAALPTEPAPEPKPAKGAKAKKTRQPATAAVAPAEAPAGEVDGEAAPPAATPPPRQKIVRKRTTAPPPDQSVQQAQPTQTTQQQTQGAFPAPMPSGSFSR
ncbi:MULTISPECIES: hypothetical protein [unclassified Bradyrhizobium]|jgi:hypothetical protein|uniref:hypothetical protein n=1 Tax=unclassified Bradyrhizobium TaxID=2631580 RepID=UPI001FF738BB|nr:MULTISPECIES: hypothetical protein [unclassified Bradyrhizobium]MCK1345393.1 hypothetical protein [Bradyrhizobium sp. CW11]MCK1468254.1 hypothetical protein [Bradyrhizobium sp. CW10]MCK1484603.1 hypothetical protein [Bradyrhizobium sp. 193]MCK1525781.1 hypothetical protein [Bradyrhizobium sp. 17]MCK1537947.1 hypothetical protein [Bradyrhizobium sp. 176]